MKHYFICYFNLTMIFFLINIQINRVLFFSQSNSIHFKSRQQPHKFTQNPGNRHAKHAAFPSPHTKKDTDDKKIIVCVNKLLLACPEKGSARGKNGLRNCECFPPRNAFPLASSLPNHPIIHLFILPSRITP